MWRKLSTPGTDARSRDAPITTAILEEKARQFATALDKPNFHVTTGWLCRWKARHGIKYKRAHGEPSDAVQALCMVRAFSEQQGGDCNAFYKVETQVHMLIANNAQQGSIRDFFSSAACTTSST
jgi:hypothetical protein